MTRGLTSRPKSAAGRRRSLQLPTVRRATSFRMSRVRHWDTEPELIIRRVLRGLGLRYRAHLVSLPGKPDIVIPAHRTVIRVHGCFWHGHKCRRGRLPASNRSYWRAKINTNRLRDRRTEAQLRKLGWSVLTVWECQVRDLTAHKLLRRLQRFKRPLISRSRT